MESRKAKISSCAAGGTAGKGSKTYKLTIPSAWINKLGLNEDAREVTMSFDGDSITITPVQTPDQFVKRRLSLGHNVVSIKYFDKKKLCSQIYADKTSEELIVENHTDLFTKTAFGKKEDPSWSDLEFFIEDRCIPRQRAGLRYYLEALDLSEYDPWSIISKTKGKMAEDDQWMEVETLS
ncbi:MAG: AbrB/MazE/SpoVT family DNA-binding domain-containing protein [Clostridiales bacterium]|nr:AbrB/MazE/SpoVT family DNA-binding domain-containing protein [Clostridiales bacterium]